MKNSIKTRIFKGLSILPNKIGYGIYHLLQNVGGNQSFESKLKSTKNTYEKVVEVLSKNNISLINLKIAELGSGWVPIFPYQLIIEGKAKKVNTYDINEHFNRKEIDQLNAFYASKSAIVLEKKGKYNLLKEVSYFPKTNICDGEIQDVDLVLSRFVLEHVTPSDLLEIHNFIYSNLKPGGLVLHLISPSDHRAYSDSSLSLQDFLKYSKEEWNQIQTKFDYHNRLRLPQYLEIFSKSFEILYFEYDKINIDSESYRKFKKLKIHDDFANFSDQELMAGSINILLQKK
ncbi:MAG TPA: class I SAM-dependent methyltransferase [Flavobacterium sp.]|uniref:class I SAM-dependent methyltransferase n=1 Tax=Flavobacterium sp. TaxID=239 RepID=UPI002DBFA326|nr:class I SAM-dependent methyltransferase [Flavobacterium sp.]HEU4788838.1 class I SAM-dependent methyltransferase [Flavobacterium sp.]